jgi:hypothetical protein
MTDPDVESIWLFFGPLNALIYGAVGFMLWMVTIGLDDSPTSQRDASDRPLDL